MKTRLQKYMAECGVASRRNAEKLIVDGKVTVNGEVVTQLGIKIDPASDKISVAGKPFKQKEKKVYIKLHKPRGYVSSCFHPGHETIMELVKDIPYRLYPVGRLDKNSEGLMILTNDGNLANRLTHPRYEHEKEYEVVVRNPISDAELEQLSQGVRIEGKKTLPAKISRMDARSFRIILREGKKRQLRRMLEMVGNTVERLKRIRIQNIQLGQLPLGKHAPLTSSELQNML
ncbi:pseudouridine synthase [candidate division WOR-1 bacterium RIFCSPLOWO2_02_FULL_46_20]|uniref:Pseudouridine synthase n=2 Tax=Saganbacteria TaxID=1703751 RepID=A0A1F4RCY8_UNCSA|nr:MAG: pseudouridine synthase [candidate division WOR-1 bacterium RIFCSPLOWO2_02_FULL_46_20]OGC09240.1 MAG: pseudouridine synthase [candidate division WOR-1 bacterium RIFCSPLOWO2_12_FULL_45_9]